MRYGVFHIGNVCLYEYIEDRKNERRKQASLKYLALVTMKFI